MSQKLSIGIDLGTTNSCVAVLEENGPRVTNNRDGDSTTPSVLYVGSEGIKVGKDARSHLLTEPTCTFVSMKRKMGMDFSREVNGKEYTPEVVASKILSRIKSDVEGELGSTVEDVVITVPANFNSVQRQATKDAGTIAGLNVLRVINEPTAAALAYGFTQELTSVMVVFDLGGGTFDISVVESTDGLYEVIYSFGDNHLGGDDFNIRIVRWIVQKFNDETGIDIRRDTPAMALAQEWAIAAKHALTNSPEVEIAIENLFDDHDFSAVLTREIYEEICRELLDRLKSVSKTVCDELSKPKYRESHPGVFENQLAGCDVLLVGGETRVPSVRRLVDDVFKGEKRSGVSPDEAVALGAAIQAGIIHRKGNVKDIVLVDTTALSLGTELEGGLFSRLIEANSPIPATKTGAYTPVVDNQESVLVGVFQGESDLCENNIKLGEFEFLLQPPRPIEEASIRLTYHLDANDILHVSAEDEKTGNQQTMVVKGTQNLSKEKVEELRREAMDSQQDTRARAREIQRSNQLKSFVNEVRKHLQQVAKQGSESKFLARTEDYADRLERALKYENSKTIESCAADLDAAWQKLLSSIPIQPTSPPKAPSQSDERDQMHQCGNCDAQVPVGFAFCGKCGVPLAKKACVSCGSALQEGFSFCGKCGKAV